MGIVFHDLQRGGVFADFEGSAGCFIQSEIHSDEKRHRLGKGPSHGHRVAVASPCPVRDGVRPVRFGHPVNEPTLLVDPPA